jgi:hypothetical protein
MRLLSTTKVLNQQYLEKQKHDKNALDLDDYAHKETHLSKEQQEKLICSIRKYPKLL